MINNILDIIRILNSGSVIPNLSDKDCEVNLSSEIATLYIDTSNSRYYYFADYATEKGDYKKNNLCSIENITLKNSTIYETVDRPIPNSSYLILFWKVEFVDDSINSHIIQLEENEFFFKKYVFYYTQDEFDAFNKWFEKINPKDISSMIEELSAQTADLNAPYASFLIKLLIKIPFFNIKFPKAILNEFESILYSKITNTRINNSKNLFDLDYKISQAIDLRKTPVEICDLIYSEILED